MKVLGLKKMFFLTLAAVTAIAACGTPESYRGTFKDAATGVTFTLTKTKATLSVPGATPIVGKIKELKFNDIVNGASFVYMADAVGQKEDPSENEPHLVDIYWITPRLDTRKTEAGLTYYEADIVYTQVDEHRKEVTQSLVLTHSRSGLVMIDVETRAWQIGWDAGPTVYNMVRVGQ